MPLPLYTNCAYPHYCIMFVCCVLVSQYRPKRGDRCAGPSLGQCFPNIESNFKESLLCLVLKKTWRSKVFFSI